MRRVQQVNYRCAQLALGCAINLAGCSIRTSTQFNECANIGYLKVAVRDCVGVRVRLCVCVCDGGHAKVSQVKAGQPFDLETL